MAAVGIDFGTSASVVAVARKRGIDTIINEVSNRSTPSFISFGEKQRFLGEPAINQQIMNFKNTVGYIKTLLGRKYKEEAAQREIKRYVNKIEELPDGEIGIHVMYKNEPHVFTPLQLTAMYFQKLKQTAEKELGRELVDVVISVPGHWTHHRRQALFQAAKVSGLNCVRLINDTTAAALSWGIYQQNLSENEAEATNVMFVDYGFANVSISLVAFNKGKLKVLASAHSETGSRLFDDALFDYFSKKVQEKYKVDVKTLPKSWKKLEVACERLKKMLTINSEGPINVENILEDKDFSGFLKRDEFEELMQPALQELQALFDKVYQDSGLPKDKVHSVEVVGSGWRPPAVGKAIEACTGKPLSKTLNQPEVVARGCAIQCAMVSPTFKVRDFAVKDYYPYSVRAEWQFVNSMSDSGSQNQGELFRKGQEVPSRRNITMARVETVEVVANYADQTEFPSDAPKLLGRWRVEVPATEPEEAQLKIKLKLNESGLVELLGAELSESTWVEETVTPTPAPTPATTDTSNSTEAMDTSGSGAAAQEGVPQPEKKRKKITKTSALPVNFTPIGVAASTVQNYHDEELKMDAEDKLVAETLEKKNELESLCIDFRQKISSDHMDFSAEKERSELTSLADRLEEWLYNDGENETKSVYVEKISQIRKLGDPIVSRKKEAEFRAEQFQRLQEYASQLVASLADPKYDHLEAADKDSIQKEVQSVLDDTTVKYNTQEAAPKHQEPTFKSFMIADKIKHLESFSRPILNKPKPKPVEDTPPPTPQTPQQDQPATPDSNQQNNQQPQSSANDQTEPMSTD